jgi:hypothetical protein
VNVPYYSWKTKQVMTTASKPDEKELE